MGKDRSPRGLYPLRAPSGRARSDLRAATILIVLRIPADNSKAQVLSFPPGEPTMTDPNCLFCRVLRGEIPAKKVYDDEHVFAFEDISPKAPTHVLIIPKRHFAGLKEAELADAELIGRCHLAAAQIARERNIEQGYRTVLNVGPGAGQSVFHLHVHLLGGRPLAWPPG